MHQDGSINTKKGFFRPFQKKKKKNPDNNATGIVPAKTVNADKNQNGENPKNNRGENTNKNDKHNGNENFKKNRSRRRRGNNNHNGKINNNQQENGSQNNKSADTNRHNNGKKQEKSRNNEIKGLSPLSKDMKLFSGISKSDIENFSAKSEKEPSLEEKYKNAVPLAEQIALEEEKRRRKPKSMQKNEIDRSGISNSDENGKEEKKAYEIIGVRFREAGKIYYFDPKGNDVPFGTPVIVETARGSEYGYTAISNRIVPAENVVLPLKEIKRIATAADTEKYLANKALEKETAKIFNEKVKALGLNMDLVFVEYTFDNAKLLFYFTSETRVDFRELVKELAMVFRTRIELRQIGVRDEAKIIGGLGACGRTVCCNTFLGDFAQVSIKMAKDQGLSLNSSKISGTCGKLMCCLRYENKIYEEELSHTPKVGAIVETADGKGTVKEVSVLKGKVRVLLDSAPDAPLKEYDRDDVITVGFNKKAAEEENMEELRSLEDYEE